MTETDITIKDANDLLRLLGSSALTEAIATAEPAPVSGIVYARDRVESIIDLYHRGLWGGEEVSLPTVARHYKVRPGLITVVTGQPQSSKSSFLNWVMVDLAARKDHSFCLYSPEFGGADNLYSRLCEVYTHLPFSAADGRMSEEDARDAVGWVGSHFYLLQDEDDTMLGLEAILDLVATLVFRHGIRGLVIDPWNELEHTRPSGTTETEYVSLCLGRLRRFARAHDLHIWVVGHPRKLEKIVGVGGKPEYPVPTPYDIAGSAHFYNKADMAIALHYVAEGKVDLYIQKVRFRECGSRARIPLYYHPFTGEFAEHDKWSTSPDGLPARRHEPARDLEEDGEDF